MSLGTPLKTTQRLAHGVSLVQSHLVKLREESRWGGREGGRKCEWMGGQIKGWREGGVAVGRLERWVM